MENIAVIIVWACVAIICIIFLVVYIIFSAVYLSVTWPWYLYRAGRRIARPR